MQWQKLLLLLLPRRVVWTATTSGPLNMTLLSRNGKLANEMLCSSKAAGPEEEHMLPTVRSLFLGGLMDGCWSPDRVKVNTEVRFLPVFTSRYCHLYGYQKQWPRVKWELPNVCVYVCDREKDRLKKREVVEALKIWKDLFPCVCLHASLSMSPQERKKNGNQTAPWVFLRNVGGRTNV